MQYLWQTNKSHPLASAYSSWPCVCVRKIFQSTCVRNKTSASLQLANCIGHGQLDFCHASWTARLGVVQRSTLPRGAFALRRSELDVRLYLLCLTTKSPRITVLLSTYNTRPLRYQQYGLRGRTYQHFFCLFIKSLHKVRIGSRQA